MLIVLAFKGLLTQLWCFIYGSEDLKQNTRNPWLGGIIIRAISLCFGYSAEGDLIQKRKFFPLYIFLGISYFFSDLKAPSNAVTNQAKCFACLGVDSAPLFV